MDVAVHTPKYQVLLHKTIRRDTVDGVEMTSNRFRGTGSVIDMTPWFGDGTSIATRKSVHEPAGGFALLLLDRPYEVVGIGMDSAYGHIEPMDRIEIRLRHGVGEPGAKLPLVMWGIVTDVRRQQGVDPNGRPQRRVSITGLDFGALLQWYRLFFMSQWLIGDSYLSTFKIFERYQVENTLTNVAFVKALIDEVINPFVVGMSEVPEAGFPNKIGVRTDMARPGCVALQAFEGTDDDVYSLMTRYLDIGPWHELFVDDDETGPTLIYRSNPALDLTGEPIEGGFVKRPSKPGAIYKAGDLVIHDLPDADIVNLDIGRSARGVANYYWVDAPSFNLNSDYASRQAGLGSPTERASIDLSGYTNSKKSLYGPRMMRVSTRTGSPDIKKTGSGLPADEHATRDGQIYEWIKVRRQSLVAQNKDNAILESGSATIRGREEIRAGHYVRIKRGEILAVYYVSDVAHSLQPFRAFTSTLTLERGTGFAERIKLAGGVSSPYLAEQVARKQSAAPRTPVF
ncbi:hypothetical protein [Methylobacterium sp. 22177]|uniref:hypothetical protein n=1 Tax=Methylobacterium sp. 22177 TaxID=3453885 RepID=UPI003F8473B2